MSKKVEQKVPHNTEQTNEKIEYLYETYQGLVRHFSKKMFHGLTREDFEDCVWFRIQELVSKGKFENVVNEKAFFYEIMKRVSWELLNEKQKQLKTINLACLSDSLLSKMDSPEEVIVKRELVGDIIKYVKTLQAPLPAIFNFYFIKGRNSRWIAHKMHINRNTIRSHLRNIRLSIKERFEDQLL
ncbi:MAG: RNA polymerase sigma factor [Planctomycetota bacterium]|jgi:RNA polymerase sigma factor (sigma-70 family)